MESALAWWNSISELEREHLQTKFKAMFDIPFPIDNGDIVNIWESEGWPEPVIDLGFDENKRTVREEILATVQDLVSNFVYYDRKEDDDLSQQQLNDALANGDITVDEIVAEFRRHLENTFNQ